MQVSKGSPCPLQLLGQLERAVLQHAFAEEWRLMQVQSHQTGQDDEPMRLEDSTFSGNKRHTGRLHGQSLGWPRPHHAGHTCKHGHLSGLEQQMSGSSIVGPSAQPAFTGPQRVLETVLACRGGNQHRKGARLKGQQMKALLPRQGPPQSPLGRGWWSRSLTSTCWTLTLQWARIHSGAPTWRQFA